MRWKKNKKQDVGLRVEVRKIAVVFAFHFSKWFTFLFNCRLMCLFAVCCPPIGYNGFGLCVRAGFGAQNCQPALSLNRSTKLQVCTSPRLTQNPCYAFALLFLSSVSLSFSLFCFRQFYNSNNRKYLSTYENKKEGRGYRNNEWRVICFVA